MQRITLVLALTLAVGAAHAQFGPRGGVPLPIQVPQLPVQLPQLPVQALPLPVQLPQLPVAQVPVAGTALQAVAPQPNANTLQGARAVQIRDLIRGNAATLEADPAGAAILRSQIVAFSPSDADLAVAQAAGFGVIGVRNLDGLDARVVILQAPGGMPTAQALARLRTLLPTDQFDFNHLYSQSGAAAEDADPGAVAVSVAAADLPAAAQIRLGLIDGGVDGAHPVFREGDDSSPRLRRRDFPRAAWNSCRILDGGALGTISRRGARRRALCRRCVLRTAGRRFRRCRGRSLGVAGA